MTTTIHPAALLAISKIEADRAAVAPGRYTGKVLVEIDFDLKVGEDYEQMINAAVDWRGLFALMASKQNAATVQAIVREFIETGASLDVDGITEPAKKAVAVALGKSARPCKGKVTGTVALANVVAAEVEVAA